LNSREKFHSTLGFNDNSQNMKVEFGYWAGTIRNWLDDGLPLIGKIPSEIHNEEIIRGSSVSLSEEDEKITDKNVLPFFNLDSYLVKFPFDVSPMIKTEVLEENSEFSIIRDSFGITKKVLKKFASVPLIIDFPIKSRQDFYNYISHYDDNFDVRLPKNWDTLPEILRNRDFPIRLGGNPFGFSFLARHLMGDVFYMLNMYDDPGLLKEFNNFFLDFIMKYWSRILDKVDIDCIIILEDVAYRSGSFISKKMFDEFMSPYYKKFVDFLKQYKIKNIFADSDGLIDELIPLWIEAGVTGIFPIEAVNDLTAIREQYPKLQLLGGVNKKVLFGDSNKEKIDKELDKISKVMASGGYIPHIDHAVSEDVTWENFKYYREKSRAPGPAP
jgi:hypothetical protein